MTQETQTPIVLPLDLVNAVLGYLGTRPYQETFQFIQAIQHFANQQQPQAEESTVKQES